MSTLSSYPGLGNPRILAPITTGLFGVLGMTTGLYGYLNPSTEAASVFGIKLPPGTTPQTRALIRTYAIRNFGNAVGGLAMFLFWRFSATCQNSVAARVVLQKVLAISYAAGSLIAFGDGLLLKALAAEDGVEGEAKELAVDKGTGHLVTGLPILGLAFAWWYL